MSERCNWAAILAGGDGERLQAFTKLVAGDERPKQFCRLFGRESLVNETRARLCLNVEPANTMCVVNRRHEAFYRSELADMQRSHLVEQPCNRGTAAAIAAALVRLRHMADDGVVAFFPADHYYRDVCAIRRTIAVAYAAAHTDPGRVFLIGAEATDAEVEYGWIQPGDRLDMPRLSPLRRHAARGVEAFHEKPDHRGAMELLSRRCLWNTFILVGAAGAFEGLIESAAPRLWDAFSAARLATTLSEETAVLHAVYSAIPALDFSHDILTTAPERLGVITMPAAGWTDLGQPSRVLDVLAIRGLRTPKLRLAAS